MLILRILKNRNFIFILAFSLGLLIGDKTGTWIKHLTVPALAIVMIVSFTQFSFRTFLDFRSLIKPSLYPILVNYFVFGAIILLLARYLIPDRQLWIGFVILASAPPGVAIPPFTKITGGDERFSVVGMVSTHVAVMVLIPLAGISFIGRSFTQPLRLIILFVEMIIVPIIVSQILIKFKMDNYLKKWRGPVVNWGLFVIIFVVIALNRNLFFEDLKIFGIISLISVISIFGSWFLLSIFFKIIKSDKSIRPNLVLFGTIKNSSFAAATALSLFGERASVPGAIFSIFLIIYLIVVGFLAQKNEVMRSQYL